VTPAARTRDDHRLAVRPLVDHRRARDAVLLDGQPGRVVRQPVLKRVVGNLLEPLQPVSGGLFPAAEQLSEQ